MRYLLDTNALLYTLLAPERLGPAAMVILRDTRNVVAISAVSAWEIAIKQSISKLTLPGPAEEWLLPAVAPFGFRWLPISAEDAVRVRGLPFHHRDPFDRQLVAQALSGQYTLVTSDGRLEAYGVPLLWT